MLASSSRSVLKHGSKPHFTHYWQSHTVGGVCLIGQVHRGFTRRWQYSTTLPLKFRPWAFNQDSTFRGSVSQLARCQYEATSHARGTRRLVPCLRLVREMKREHVRPDLTIYNSLLACIAEEGLPLEARAVMDDMIAMGILPDRQSYHHASRWSPLEATWETLEKMADQGIPPNEQTYALIIKRITATEGIELALQFMHEMAKRGFTPDLTATQDVIKLAAHLNFPRLAIDITQNFEAHSVRRIDGETWMSCLVSSAESLYADGVQKCWEKAIHDMNLTPDEGTCIAVLHTCARHGLPDLATDVIRVLRSIGVDWQEYHFAPLLEAFSRVGKLKEAFGTLHLLRSNGIVPLPETTQPITDILKRDLDAVDGVWKILDELRDEGHTIDAAAVNTIIEASVALGDLQRAVGAYKAIREYTSKPDVETFNHLLQGCINAEHRELGDKLLLDLKQANVRPNALTYERTILLCLTQPTYEDAFFYLEEMKAQKIVPPLRVYEAIVRTCVAAGDSRYALALAELEQCGYSLSKDLQRHVATNRSS
ncbi:hypothetical protein EV401DRAFT_1905625 [Pisolithus croceorrhizus]|nr:hypothetical protein EV401DRAFT_1905625 [Pisolithus croceorrhizus]